MRVPTPRLTRAEVEHVAQLARLALTDDEIDALTAELGRILDHAAQVSALDTAGVPPTAHPLPLVNVFRADVPRAGCSTATRSSRPRPTAEDGRFRVPRILGEEP